MRQSGIFSLSPPLGPQFIGGHLFSCVVPLYPHPFFTYLSQHIRPAAIFPRDTVHVDPETIALSSLMQSENIFFAYQVVTESQRVDWVRQRLFGDNSDS